MVDPACGSGAFLVAAFELLAREYRGVIELLEVFGEAVDFDPFDEIVTKNLYGVDINAEIRRNYAAGVVAEDGAQQASAAKPGSDYQDRR